MQKKLGLKPRTAQRFRLTAKPVLVAASMGFLVAVFVKLTVLQQIAVTREAQAAPVTATIPVGSFIVNMGINPQSYDNGLKPYGMIYELLEDHHVPVYWVIDTTKAKDGVDFTYNLTDYSGGPFIIDAAFIDGTVAGVIADWQTEGVVGVYTTSTVSVPIYDTLTYWPQIMIDNVEFLHQICIDYFDHAGIPGSGYAVGQPVSLTSCYDLWINPHGNPRWPAYQYLYDFVTREKGFLWLQCHSASVMEGIYGNVASLGNAHRRLNWLATDGLQCWKGGGGFNCDSSMQTHASSSTGPYTYNYSGDPVMQFIGEMDGPTTGGSEQWYIPQTSGSWRSSVLKLVTTSDGTPPNEGVLLTYGYAFGDPDNGMVMYTGGHDLDAAGGDVTEWVAAQRSLFNYVLLTGLRKAPGAESAYSIPTSFNQFHGQTMQAVGSADSIDFTYSWSSSLLGTFSNPTGNTTSWTPGNYTYATTGIITVTITDDCDHVNYISIPFSYTPSPLPVTLAAFRATVNVHNQVDLEWMTMSEVNNDFFTVERSADGWRWEDIAKVEGAGTTSSATKYHHTDEHPLQGISYYRLRQTDYNGRSEVFSRARVNLPLHDVRAGSLKAFPNPFARSLTAQFTAEESEEVSLQLITLDGRKIYDERIFTQPGVNSINLNLPAKINPGIYMLHVTNESSMVASAKVLRSFN